MLNISDLSLSIDNAPIVDSLSLVIPKGQLHVLFGPNGSGKSTLIRGLAGDPKITLDKGEIYVDGQGITTVPAQERFLGGMMVTFQIPPTLPGVQIGSFLKAIYENWQQKNSLPNKTPKEILELIKQLLTRVGLSEDMYTRFLDEQLSGGERKRLELVQVMMFHPKMIIMDELDSGLDVQFLHQAGEIIQDLRSKERSILIISHNPSWIQQLNPDKIHIFTHGKIVESGGLELLTKKVTHD